MSVPKYSDFLLPLLQYASDGQVHYIRDATEAIADHLMLSEDVRNELMPSGQPKYAYRMHWANTYLKKAGLLRSAGRGLFRITDRGMNVLEHNLDYIDRDFLMQFPEFAEFARPTRTDDTQADDAYISPDETPKELMQNVYESIRAELADELLEYVVESSPAFFEKLVVDLLLAMGYGGSLADAGKSIGRSGDEGIDGYIQEDKLGLDMIYLQAKRWSVERSVGRPEIQGFVGSLMGVGARKGVFITTAKFSDPAIEFAQRLQNAKVILIDGTTLTQLMIEHNVGVSVERHYVLKRVDSDYFNPT